MECVSEMTQHVESGKEKNDGQGFGTYRKIHRKLVKKLCVVYFKDFYDIAKFFDR